MARIITGGAIFKRRGQEALLVCSRIELEEAKQSGLRVMTDAEFGFQEMLAETEGDGIAATVKLWTKVMAWLGLFQGRVGLYGAWQINQSIALYNLLRRRLPQYDIVAESKTTLFQEAMLTKDQRRDRPAEIGGGARERSHGCRLGFHRWLDRRRRRTCWMTAARL